MAYEPKLPQTRIHEVPPEYERALRKAQEAGQLSDEEASVLRLIQAYGPQKASADASAALAAVSRRQTAKGSRSEQQDNEALAGLRQQGGDRA